MASEKALRISGFFGLLVPRPGVELWWQEHIDYDHRPHASKDLVDRVGFERITRWCLLGTEFAQPQSDMSGIRNPVSAADR